MDKTKQLLLSGFFALISNSSLIITTQKPSLQGYITTSEFLKEKANIDIFYLDYSSAMIIFYSFVFTFMFLSAYLFLHSRYK